jgi:hypothetical protein
VWLTLVLTGTPVQWLLIRLGHAPAVTQDQVHLFTIISWGLLALDALLGLLILRRRWRRATTPNQPRLPAPLPLVAAGGGQG